MPPPPTITLSTRNYLFRHLNKLRWLVLSTVFLLLILLPYFHIYQNFVAAHAYALLLPSERTVYDVIEAITSPFVSDPRVELDAIKGTTWSATLFGLRLSDPLAVVSQVAAGMRIYWPFLLTALIPVALTLIFGRFFCGWLCPANLLYDLADKTSTALRRVGLSMKNERRRFDRRLKYVVLVVGIAFSVITGMGALSMIYPPAIVGRELLYMITYTGVGTGTAFFLLTMLFDMLVARRGVCRYLCPGGALYSLLGRYRVLRIRRIVEKCNDCFLCNIECPFGLDPKRDGFGQECNNCTACIAVCPTDALAFEISIKDHACQGPGHLGAAYNRHTGIADKADTP